MDTNFVLCVAGYDWRKRQFPSGK